MFVDYFFSLRYGALRGHFGACKLVFDVAGFFEVVGDVEVYFGDVGCGEFFGYVGLDFFQA